MDVEPERPLELARGDQEAVGGDDDGLDVEDVEMRKADLEDVFIDLMAGEQTPLEVAR